MAGQDLAYLLAQHSFVMHGARVQAFRAGIPRISDGRGGHSTSGVASRSASDLAYGIGMAKLFTFGAIADVQYADCDDGWNWNKTMPRYFRGTLGQLRKAVDRWLGEESLSFVLQLGDIIDGRNAPGGSEAALASVRAELVRLMEALPLGVLNSLGNHELYNFPKERWARELDCSSRGVAPTLRPPGQVPGPFLMGLSDEACSRGSSRQPGDGGEDGIPERFYYSFCPDPGYRFIALDTYDMNAIREPGRGDGGGRHPRGGGVVKSAVDMLEERNPNPEKNSSANLDGLEKRFVQYNGGVGPEQLRWLEQQLADASRAGQRVVVFGHVPLHPAVTDEKALLWNFEDVLAVFHRFDCVAVCLSGHRHQNGYHQDERGIHYVSLAAALETPAHEDAFASIDVFPDRLELRGHGVIESRTMHLPSRIGKLLVG